MEEEDQIVAPLAMAVFIAAKACPSGVATGRHVIPRRPKPVVGGGLGMGIVESVVDVVPMDCCSAYTSFLWSMYTFWTRVYAGNSSFERS